VKSSPGSVSSKDFAASYAIADPCGAWLFESDNTQTAFTDTQIAFAASPVATVLCNLAGQIIQGNRAFRELLDIDPLQSIDCVDIATLCSGRVALDFIDALARDGAMRQMELAIKAPGKHSLRALCTASRVNADEGIACWLIITFDQIIDAPANRWASIDVATVESELEKLAGIGYWRLDLRADADCLDCDMYWSSGMFSLMNCKPSQSPKTFRHWLDRVAPADRKTVMDGVRALALRGEESTIQYRLAAHREQATTILSRARKIEMTAGSEGQVLIGVEQQECKSSEEKHNSSTACLLQAIVENSESPIFAIDSGFRMVCSNDAFRNFLCRKSVSEAISLNDFTATLPDLSQRQRVTENLRRALAGEIRVDAAEVYRDGMGRHRYNFTYTPVRASAGDVIGVAVLGADASIRTPAAFMAETKRPRLLR
jgi:PAS domain-containing protein